MEIIDYFTEDGKLLGQCSKKMAHEKGYWHQTVGCLLVDTKKSKVYLQYKNSKHNDLANINKVDISVGGHLKSLETKKDIVREIKEETSLDVNYDDLIFAGTRKVNIIINSNYAIREFYYVFLYDNEFDLNKLKSLDDEVIFFIEFDLEDLEDFLQKERKSIKGKTIKGEIIFKRDEFIKGYLEDHVYEKYIDLAKKLRKGKKGEWNEN